MPRYGSNIDYFCQKSNYFLSNQSICDIGRAMLFTLQATHKAGYVYNDLKLDNLMVGFDQKVLKNSRTESIFKHCTFHLIDFGFATRYID